MAAFEQLKTNLWEVGINLNMDKTFAAPLQGHQPTPSELERLSTVGINLAPNPSGFVTLGAPVGTYDFIQARMAEVIEGSGTRALAAYLSEMEDKQVAWLLNSWSLSSRLGYLVRVTPPLLARSTMEQADNTSLWTLERTMEIADATETHQQVQAQMPTSAGGLGLSSMKHRQHAAFVGSLVA
ncbi:unnamed protein product, partial [Choristocarpus tenellus]